MKKIILSLAFLFTIISNQAEARFCSQSQYQLMIDNIIGYGYATQCPTSFGNYFTVKNIKPFKSIYGTYVVQVTYNRRKCLDHSIDIPPEYVLTYNTLCSDEIDIDSLTKYFESPQNSCGSIVHNSTQVLGESIPIVGATFNLNYFSNRVIGRTDDYIIKIPITPEVVLPHATGYNLKIKNDLGTQVHSSSYGTSTNQVYYYATTGLTGTGAEPWTTAEYTVSIEELGGVNPLEYSSIVRIGNLKNKKLGLGGWVPSIWYYYGIQEKKLYKPDGTERSVEAVALTGGFYLVAENDGSLVYIFDSTGKIVETKLGLTGQVVYSFYYDGNGRLSYINEPFSKTTSFNRNGSGVLTSITGSNGKVTTVTHDGNGYLATLTNLKSEAYQMSYHGTGGLLATFEKPNGAISSFTYTNGNLTKDEHSGGAEINLSKTYNTDGSFITIAESKLNRLSTSTGGVSMHLSYEHTDNADGSRLVTESTNQSRKIEVNGVSEITYFTPSARFGNTSDNVTSLFGANFGVRTEQFSNAITYSTPGDPFSINTWVKSIDVGPSNQYPVTQTYTGSTKTTVTQTSLGKTNTTQIDNYQRPISVQRGGLNPSFMTYTNDKLTQITQGTRVTSYTYNSTSKLLETVTNALNEVTEYEYDDAERLIRTYLPDGRVMNFDYTATGKLSMVKPSLKPEHYLNEGANERLASYVAPSIGFPSTATNYYYNDDNQMIRAQVAMLNKYYNYDSVSGRLESIVSPTVTYSYTYGALGNKLSLPTKITTTDGTYADLSYSYGSLSGIAVKDSGTNNTIYQYTASSSQHSQLNSEVLAANNTTTVNYTYDSDEYLSQAGDIVLDYNSPNGELIGTTLGSLNDDWSYNAYGELEEYEFKYNSTVLYKTDYTRDALGRITQKIENLNGLVSTFDYIYDVTGRLTEVKKNTVTVSTYAYDNNNNRNGGNNGTPITASYDNQDRITAYKNHTFTHFISGETGSKTYVPTGDLTSYSHNFLGGLTQVQLPSKTINYEIDALNRRLGRKDNGVLLVRYAYDKRDRIIGELNPVGDVIRRYVYASKAHVPDYFFDQSNIKYRLVTDNLGSVRLVVRENDGVIMQQMEHDEYGRIVSDSNPGYQPFGFAGGIWDHETALVRFGARDYDVMTGRWMAKDPILFKGGDTNLYGYVLSDPINHIDPLGLYCNMSQSSGQTICSDRNGNITMINNGYSGSGEGVNNPAMQGVVNTGPIPQGSYSVGNPVNSAAIGNALPLTPINGTNTLGRSGFYIHGDNPNKPPRSSSSGCPIINNPNRSSIRPGDIFNVVQ